MGMAAGEYPVPIYSPNIEITIMSTTVSSSGNLTLEIPASASQLANDQIKQKITLGPLGLSQCPNIGAYAQLSLLQWSTNPYAGSIKIVSPLMRISSAAQPTDTAKLSSRMSRSVLGGNSYNLPGVPAYTLSIQYSSYKNFDFIAGEKYKTAVKSATNYTIPVCKQYNGVTYVPCKGCDISSYTNYNVTYSCFDITQLCPNSVVRRRLLDHDGVNEDDNEDDARAEADKGGEEVNADVMRMEPPSRLLQPTEDEESFDRAVPSTYGTLIETVAVEFSTVISSNPFARSPSPVVLSFVGCLSGCIILILICLLRKDEEDKTFKDYVKTESDLRARKLLEEDIRNGLKGDHGMMYQEHLSKCHKESKGGTIICSLSRTYTAGSSMTQMDSTPQNSGDAEMYPSKFNSSSWTHGSYGGSYDGSDNATELLKDDKEFVTEATVTEFVHKLFPGYAIFTKKTSIFDLIIVNHRYIRMLSSHTMKRTKTILFLQLVTVIIVGLFVDTVFFGVFYPANVCPVHTDEVCTYYACTSQLLTSVQTHQYLNAYN